VIFSNKVDDEETKNAIENYINGKAVDIVG
jgi:hypothetical protein